jgi:hypothetical protein
MAVDFIKQKEKQKKLVSLVVVVIIITGLILWFGYFRDSDQGVEEAMPSVSTIREIKVNFDILDQPFLEEIIVFEEIPPFEGEAGRENPFLPY